MGAFPGYSGASGPRVWLYSGEGSGPSLSPFGNVPLKTISWVIERALGQKPGGLGVQRWAVPPLLALVPATWSMRTVGLMDAPTLDVSLQTENALGRTRHTSRRGRCSL